MPALLLLGQDIDRCLTPNGDRKLPLQNDPQSRTSISSFLLENKFIPDMDGERALMVAINQSINQLYLNTVNGSASWFSDMPCDNYNF